MRPTVLLFLAACGASEAPDGLDSADPSEPGSETCGAFGPTVEPGVGATGYTAIDADVSTLLFSGGQGTQHIEAAGRVSGSTSEVVEVTATLAWQGQTLTNRPSPVYMALAGWDETGCTGDFFGFDVLIEDETGQDMPDVVCALEGDTVDLTITVRDMESGRSTTATGAVRVEYHDDTRTYCAGQ